MLSRFHAAAARRRSAGFSYLEMIVACAVVSILATAVIPVARWDEKRRREARLRAALEHMRSSLDLFNRYMADGLIEPEDVQQCAVPAVPETCWPLTLESLVEGVEVGDPQSPNRKTVIFLPRIPVDPFTGEAVWGMRSFQDDWDSRGWGGENVYDVYSLSPMRALDDTYYSEW